MSTTRVVAYLTSALSVVTVLACLVAFPVLLTKLAEIDYELTRDMAEFDVSSKQKCIEDNSHNSYSLFTTQCIQRLLLRPLRTDSVVDVAKPRQP